MSYSHTQRRKTIKRFKKEFGKDKWHSKFLGHIKKLEKERLGEPMGTLEDILCTKCVHNDFNRLDKGEQFCSNQESISG